MKRTAAFTVGVIVSISAAAWAQGQGMKGHDMKGMGGQGQGAQTQGGSHQASGSSAQVPSSAFWRSAPSSVCTSRGPTTSKSPRPER